MSERDEPSVAEWVDDIADQYEKAWQGMQPPRPVDYLGDTTGERRAALLAELIKIDLAYRAKLGDHRQPIDYGDDFSTPDPAASTLQPGEARLASANKSWPSIPGYEILGELGQGGMGVVYKARQLALKRIVALKMIPAGMHAGPRERTRFHTEMEAVARLQHPHIVQIHEVGEQDGRPYCALEYVDGGSLAQRLNGTPQPPRKAAELIETLARAVHFAHEHQIIHRDLKPANILLSSLVISHSSLAKNQGHEANDQGLMTNDQGLIAKIADFGLAKQLNGDSTDGAGAYRTQTGEILGTPSYMAPEQAEGKPGLIGPATDIYSLGAILYEMLTGRPPFKGESTLETLEQVRSQEPVPPSRLLPRLPRDLATICMKCVAKEPAKRYANALLLAEDLRRFLDGKTILARPVGQLERSWRWCRRKPAVAALTAAVLLVLLAGTVVSTLFAVRADQGAKEARRHLYGSNMNLAQRYWEQGQISHTLALLDQHKPRPGAPDDRGWEWHYLSRLCHGDLRTLKGHMGPVNAIAFSPDGRRLASIGEGIWVWDSATGQVLHTFSSVPGGTSAVAFSPDDRLLAWAGVNEEARVWSAAADQMLATVPGSCIAFSPDSRLLATGGGEGIIRVWNPLNGQLVHTLEGHSKSVINLAFSPDGQRLASASQDQTVKLWDVAGSREVRTFWGHADQVNAVTFSPDGQRLASAGLDWTARIWEVASGRTQHILKGHTSSVSSVAFSPSGQQLASASADSTIKLWSVASGEELAALRGHISSVNSVVFSPDGRRLASAGHDGTIKLWDAPGGQEAHGLPGHHGVAFSPDGRYLAAPGPGRTVKIWDATGLQVVRILKGHSRDVWTVAYSPDGRRLAAGSGVIDRGKWVSGEVTVWDTETGRVFHTLRAHASRVFGVTFSPDGRRLATGSGDGTVKIWDAATGQELHSFGHVPRAGTDQKTAVHQVAFHPHGRLLASASDDYTVKVWDTVDGRELRTLEGHTGWVYGVAFSADGRYLASVDDHKMVKVWHVATGLLVHNLLGHNIAVNSVAFHPHEERLVTGDALGIIKIWDVATGQELCTLKGHSKQVWGLAFSLDGYRLASASQDETVKIWDARPLTPEVAVEREAAALVTSLFADPSTKEQVIAHLRSDRTISDPVRQEALAQAERALDDSDYFDTASWTVVRRPCAAADLYRKALGWAETACRLNPDRQDYLTTLGAAQYRVGRYHEALVTLTQSEQLNTKAFGLSVPQDLALLCMARYRLGQSDQAQALLAQLRKVMKWPFTEDKEALGLLREAEELLAEKQPNTSK
jgi:WD40 repeat protein/serine/threonine protein kinase